MKIQRSKSATSILETVRPKRFAKALSAEATRLPRLLENVLWVLANKEFAVFIPRRYDLESGSRPCNAARHWDATSG